MDGKSEQLHELTTFNADKSIILMATEMNDSDLPMKVAHGDLVAISAMGSRRLHKASILAFRVH